MVRSGQMRKKAESIGTPAVPGWLRPRGGGFGMYLVALLFLLGIVSLLFFFPQYMNMRTGIYRISCKEIRKKIERAVADYDANNTMTIVKPGKTIDLDFLKETGFLAEIQYCPEKGTYKFGPQGEVYCTQHTDPDRPQPAEERTATTGGK
ncbi:MAG: hypothetical protein GX442_17795 [Candidatus Riflebacteria bacterium]|nr:hypothetical protein [Candidatus Riflebacteria bacterium]